MEANAYEQVGRHSGLEVCTIASQLEEYVHSPRVCVGLLGVPRVSLTVHKHTGEANL